MQYVPNRRKVCSRCGKIILYNEEYTTIDQLGPDNEVVSEHAHSSCKTDIGGESWGQIARKYISKPIPPPQTAQQWPSPYYTTNVNTMKLTDEDVQLLKDYIAEAKSI